MRGSDSLHVEVSQSQIAPDAECECVHVTEKALNYLHLNVYECGLKGALSAQSRKALYLMKSCVVFTVFKTFEKPS